MTEQYNGNLNIGADGSTPASISPDREPAGVNARRREIVATEDGRAESVEHHIALGEEGDGQNADGTMVVKKWQFTVFPYRGKGYRIEATDAVHAIPLARRRAQRAFRADAQSGTTSRHVSATSESKSTGAESAEGPVEAPSIADMLLEGVRTEKERRHEAARGALFATLIAQYLEQYPDADARANALTKARGYGFTFYDDKVKAMLEDPEVAASHGGLYGAYDESADALAGENAEARRALREADKRLFNEMLAQALESGVAPKAEEIRTQSTQNTPEPATIALEPAQETEDPVEDPLKTAEKQHDVARAKLLACVITRILTQFSPRKRARTLEQARAYEVAFNQDGVREKYGLIPELEGLFAAYDAGVEALSATNTRIAKEDIIRVDTIFFNEKVVTALTTKRAPTVADLTTPDAQLGTTTAAAEASHIAHERSVELGRICKADFEKLRVAITAEVKRLVGLKGAYRDEGLLARLIQSAEKGGIEFNTLFKDLNITDTSHAVSVCWNKYETSFETWRKENMREAYATNVRYRSELDHAVLCGFVEGNLDKKDASEHDAALSEARNEYFKERAAIFKQLYRPDVVRCVGKIAKLRATPPNGTYDAADTEAERLIHTEIATKPHSGIANAHVRYQKTVDLWVAKRLTLLPEGQRQSARSHLLSEEASRYKQAMRGARS